MACNSCKQKKKKIDVPVIEPETLSESTNEVDSSIEIEPTMVLEVKQPTLKEEIEEALKVAELYRITYDQQAFFYSIYAKVFNVHKAPGSCPSCFSQDVRNLQNFYKKI